MSDSTLQIPARLCRDPRLVSGAKLLGIPKAHFFGNMLHLLCQAVDYAEDGDLWRGDEDSSIRFTAALADWPDDAPAFVFALQQPPPWRTGRTTRRRSSSRCSRRGGFMNG